ncbi:MAG: hypothetical protein H7240_04805 [Glaciimonas sp.]|nr:hypothetical protein [Glaciimonas sp.]
MSSTITTKNASCIAISLLLIGCDGGGGGGVHNPGKSNKTMRTPVMTPKPINLKKPSTFLISMIHFE